MKKSVQFLFASLVLVGMLFVSSCQKDVTISYNIADVEICFPANSSTFEYVDSFEIQQSDLKAAFAVAKTTYDLSRIKSVGAKGFRAVITTSGANFNGIKGLQAYIKTKGTSGDEKQIALSSEPIADGSTDIELIINGPQLKSMLGDIPLVVTLRVYLKDPVPSTGACVKLTKGTIQFEAKN